MARHANPAIVRSLVNRRRFLGSTAAITGGLLLPGTAGLAAEAQETQSKYPATDHFWYRPQPAGPYTDSQRDHRAFGFAGGMIYLSEDNGRSWPHRLEFAEAENITFSCILQDASVLFATRTKLYLSTDKLKTYREITVKQADGADYLPHTPQNPDNPGWYFHPLHGVHTWDVDGAEMVVWGNYCNVMGGATPVNIYYSVDGGRTVKIAYSFGQNPYYRDNGSRGGGSSGTLLGDPDNPVICRHIHCVAYNPAENAFYACTGDRTRPEGPECNWLRGTYDVKKDAWRWQVVVSGESNSRYKAGGINFVDGKLYWIADANGPKPHDRGVFCCDPVDIAHPDKHTRLFNPEYEAANMIIQDGTILAAHYATASPYACGFIFSPDMGRTWAQYDLPGLGKRSAVRIQRKNSEGWFRVDLRSGWIQRAEVLFIKPKENAPPAG